ncbi:MAG: ComF family protein [Tepidisphaeraceae bacterium]
MAATDFAAHATSNSPPWNVGRNVRTAGAPLAMVDAHCQRCLGRGYRLFDEVVNLGVYSDPLRPLVHRLKYYHGWTLGELLADRAMNVPRVRDVLSQTDVLIPVPLHGWRQLVRGFNQADVIARRLGKLAGVRVRKPAIRLRHTAAQSLQTNRLDRMRNLSGAFAVTRPGVLKGRRVTLVDDVMTTGSTLKALARAVATAGPEAINVFTIALADPTGHDFEAV